jgi:hypothetical protein
MENRLNASAIVPWFAANLRVAFGEKPETTHDIAAGVGRKGRQGILLEHASDYLEFALGLGVGLVVYPFLTLGIRQIGLVESVYISWRKVGYRYSSSSTERYIPNKHPHGKNRRGRDLRTTGETR